VPDWNEKKRFVVASDAAWRRRNLRNLRMPIFLIKFSMSIGACQILPSVGLNKTLNTKS
jgi:hypothetical protein